MKTLKAYCPVSIGNFAVGFDVVGAAVAPQDGSLWGDVVELRAADTFSFRAEGPFASRLPPPEENLVLRAKKLFVDATKQGKQLQKVEITLHKNLPVKSGLGSSTASLIAALTAFNAWCGKPLSLEELMVLGGRGEGSVSGGVHVDNVAPALLGGLQLITPSWNALPLPFPEELSVVMVSPPELEVATSVARAALPKEVPLQTAVTHAQNLATFIHALHTHELELLRQTLRDLLAEPHRASLIKGFREVKAAALATGAIGCSISGAGPAIFAVAEAAHAQKVATAMKKAFNAVGVECQVRVCGLDKQGARLIP